ncbi:hypothetical protein C6V07_01725 [Burkholderia gladioli]|nr:hypothetical protein C6V07_01725 [Burkholderia gladioli]
MLIAFVPLTAKWYAPPLGTKKLKFPALAEYIEAEYVDAAEYHVSPTFNGILIATPEPLEVSIAPLAMTMPFSNV